MRAKGSQRGCPHHPGWASRSGSAPTTRSLGAYETVSVDRSEGVRFGQRELLMDAVMTRRGCPRGVQRPGLAGGAAGRPRAPPPCSWRGRRPAPRQPVRGRR
ncbi:MAG: hypothetical protein R3F43_26940 [bacterium]